MVLSRFITFVAVALLAVAAVGEARKLTQAQIAARVNAKQRMWVASAKMPIAMLSDQERLRLIDTKVPHKKFFTSNLPVKHRTNKKGRDALPLFFDARAKWPQCNQSINQVRNQLRCSSCWAFGTINAMSDRECIANGRVLPLSAGELIACASDSGGKCGSCKKGWADCAYNYWYEKGIVSERCMPYTLTPCTMTGEGGSCPTGYESVQCSAKCVKGVNESYAKDRFYASTIGASFDGEVAIMEELYANGPVTLGMVVYQDFFGYKTGVYSHQEGEEAGRHFVKVVGWGEERDPETKEMVPYWLIMNSWGTRFGDKGWAKIRRGVNECNIESVMRFGVAKRRVAPVEASSSSAAPVHVSSSVHEASSAPAPASSSVHEASSAPAPASSSVHEASSVPAPASSSVHEASSVPAPASSSVHEASSVPAHESSSVHAASSVPAHESSAAEASSASEKEVVVTPFADFPLARDWFDGELFGADKSPLYSSGAAASADCGSDYGKALTFSDQHAEKFAGMFVNVSACTSRIAKLWFWFGTPSASTPKCRAGAAKADVRLGVWFDGVNDEQDVQIDGAQAYQYRRIDIPKGATTMGVAWTQRNTNDAMWAIDSVQLWCTRE